MKKSHTTLLALAVALSFAVPSYASAPSTSAEVKKPQADHQAKGKKGKSKKSGPKQARHLGLFTAE